MSKKEIKSIPEFDTSLWQKVMDEFTRATGLPARVIDLNGEDITNPKERPLFCNLIHKTKEGKKLCKKANIEVAIMAINKGKVISLPCHAKLRNIAIPLKIPNMKLVALVGEHILTEKPDENWYRDYANKIGVDPEEMIKEIKGLKIIPGLKEPATVELFANLLARVEDQIREHIALIEREKEKSNRLAILYDVSKSLATTIELKNLLNEIMGIITKVLKVGAVSIFLVPSDRKDILVLEATTSEDLKPKIKKAEYKLGEGLTGWIAEKRESVNIIDPSKDPKGKGKYKEFFEEEHGAFLGVPLIVEDDLIGVVRVVRRKERKAFSDDDKQLLSTIGGEIAMVIRNARYVEELKTLDRLKSDFIHNIAHSLKTPLHSINACADALLDDADKLPDRTREYLRTIKGETNRFITVVNELVNLARLEAGTLKVSKGVIDMSFLIAELVHIFEPEANSKKINISTDIPKGLVINGDKNLMREVFNNLISNAIKFSKKSGGKVEIIAEVIKYNEAQIEICDEGIGISEEDLPYIFEKFYQPKVEIPGREKGLGIGLAFVKQIITAHGGTIESKSKIGEGTKITLILPEVYLKEEDRREDRREAITP